MIHNILRIRFVCMLAAMLAVGVHASAQQPSGGPFSGLFKGSPKEQPQTLDLNASAFGGYDDNVLAQTPLGGGGFGQDPQTVKPGVANGFQGSIAYGFHRAGTRTQFSLNGVGSFQQFASDLGGRPLRFQSYSFGTVLRTSITNKSSISFGASSAYAPFYQYAPFLKNTTSEESPVGNDYGFAVNSNWVRSASASVSIEDRLTKKSSITGGIGWMQSTVVSGAAPDRSNRSASMAFTHSLTRKLAFHVGYGVAEERDSSNGQQTAPPVLNHTMDIGLGYGDGLTLTFGRHYTLSFAVGASITKNGDPVSVATTGKSTAFGVTGNATLSRSIGRSWGTSLGYVRGTSYFVGFPQPLNTNSANAGIGGPLTSRLQFSAGAGASQGQQVFVASSGSLISYSASTRLTYGLLKNLGLYAQASYYRISIPTDFMLPGLLPNLDRRSVSVGLSTWFPLIKPGRGNRIPDQTTAGQP